MLKLLSYEKKLLADFILMSPEMQESVFTEAMRNPAVSGSLLSAYRLVRDSIA